MVDGALPQREGIGLAVLGHFPALGQNRPDRQVGAVADEGFEDLVHDRVGVGITLDAVGGPDIGIQADIERATLPWRLLGHCRQGNADHERGRHRLEDFPSSN